MNKKIQNNKMIPAGCSIMKETAFRSKLEEEKAFQILSRPALGIYLLSTHYENPILTYKTVNKYIGLSKIEYCIGMAELKIKGWL